MHCNYIEEYGKTYVGSKWETKHPYLGCHPKKGYTVKDLVRLSPLVAAMPTRLSAKNLRSRSCSFAARSVAATNCVELKFSYVYLPNADQINPARM